MLKRLELIGFKSFADKTIFEFPAGVTAIVGPNGSGKSNIVDAVKWVLGEQSAKSLRGGEMADVIFNGSTSRKSLGMAEVALVFDNARGTLSTSATEVQIARRVYRDGEGEYLVNGQPSRLKDIKDLFLGSGAGAGAYGIIEQGRVDAMLQASTIDRRAIFEEAAGISRFKVKKIEALRRLERVESNLQRLRDILSEVDNQLRSVRLQAAKAQRFQEHTVRLRELRLDMGLHEYRRLSGMLDAVEHSLVELRAILAAAAARSATWSDNAQRLESEAATLDTRVRDLEADLAQLHVTRTAVTAGLAHDREQAIEFETALARLRQRLSDEIARIADLTSARTAAETDWHGVEAACTAQRREVAALDERHRVLHAELAEGRRQIESDQASHLESLRLAARMQNDAVSAHAHLEHLRRERDRLSHKSTQASEHLATLDHELESLKLADGELQVKCSNAQATLDARREELDANRRSIDAGRQRLSDLKALQSGLNSRIEVLEGLERSHEGLGTGIREVLAELETDEPQSGLRSCVIALAGNALSAARESAHLLDIALGNAAQCFVVTDTNALIAALTARRSPFSGRVGFVPLQTPTGLDSTCTAPCPTEIVRADRLANCEVPELAGLAEQLLGSTWIVPNLSAARDLAAQLPNQRFVTTDGELLESDGTLTVGLAHAESGILSRKSELRELRQQVTDAVAATTATEHDLDLLTERGELLNRTIRDLQQEIGVLVEQSADLRERVGQRRERRDGLHEEVALSRSELTGLDTDIERLETTWNEARTRSASAEQTAHELQARIAATEAAQRSREQERHQAQDSHTAAQVALAQIEERLTALRERHEQLAGSLLERHVERDRIAAEIDALEERLDASVQAQIRSSAELAETCSSIERLSSQTLEIVVRRDAAREALRGLHSEMQTAHSEWQSQQASVHSHELQHRDLQHQRDAVVQRVHDDCQLDLADEAAAREAASTPDDSILEAASAEIDDLRKKLSRLGSVSLDSLQELAELELRHGALQVQFDDLTAAQKSLHEIIATINDDSRRLFTETFVLVRGNFQDLFRKLFGGGQADVILENENDVLESGIEVVARPPGKELRSISLMSGGEKTLTAVALLLAIFRSKPSPFCLLDEVDAALDEANTARLAHVLKEFQDRSQFIIVTHSKRTMASADVLYGVTMQESGVSKRIAVRFEDWPDDQRAAA